MEDIINEIKNGSIGSYLNLYNKIKTKEELILIFEALEINNTITSIYLPCN